MLYVGQGMRTSLCLAALPFLADPIRPSAIHVFPTKAEMDEIFTCPAEAGGGYYSSRADGGEGKEDEHAEYSGSLPLRLRVRVKHNIQACFFNA